jgi:hypothetical protein
MRLVVLHKCVAVAKGKGAYRGRKRALSAEQVAEIRQRAAAGEHKAALAREFNDVPPITAPELLRIATVPSSP